jgi:hypothetical protein
MFINGEGSSVFPDVHPRGHGSIHFRYDVEWAVVQIVAAEIVCLCLDALFIGLLSLSPPHHF